jgi:hypothetical protein
VKDTIRAGGHARVFKDDRLRAAAVVRDHGVTHRDQAPL